jgi:predicted phosphohydrolase
MIRWLTDLHLDHAPPEKMQRLHEALRSGGPDPVILTGDISTASRLTDDLERLADAAETAIYFVLGNHDHYGASVGSVRDRVLALTARRPEIAWLPPAGVVTLAPGIALVGVDGWADGRHGNPLTTPLVLNDDKYIRELAEQSSRAGRLAVRRTLADADAARLETLLGRARDGGATRIIVATHVPPFPDALASGQRIAHPHWHPLLVSGATGGVLETFARAHPTIHLDVRAGHSHAAAAVTIHPNLTVRVGGARYGRPTIQPAEGSVQ